MMTVMASSLYRLLGAQEGDGYESSKIKHIFRDLANATAQVTLTKGQDYCSNAKACP
jgi:hypothetical protein